MNNLIGGRNVANWRDNEQLRDASSTTVQHAICPFAGCASASDTCVKRSCHASPHWVYIR